MSIDEIDQVIKLLESFKQSKLVEVEREAREWLVNVSVLDAYEQERHSESAIKVREVL